MVDGTPSDPLALTEAIIAAAVDRCAATVGSPDHVVVTYPLDRSDGSQELLTEAAARATGGRATMVPAPSPQWPSWRTTATSALTPRWRCSTSAHPPST